MRESSPGRRRSSSERLPLDPAYATFARGDTDIARMSPLEIAAGMVYGRQPRAVVPPPIPAWLSPREALEHAAAVALSRPPCVVSFSGGRDSSAVLALATFVARRDGFPLPIPVTLRFDDDASHEDEWQEQLIKHLDLSDWVRLRLHDELDLIGDLAMQVLAKSGVIWPFNAHFHLPIAAQARGGSVLTGVGGDEVLAMSPLSHRVNRVLARRVGPNPRDIARVAAALGPRPLKAALVRRSYVPVERPWVTADAQRRLEERRFAHQIPSSFVWGRSLARSGSSRYIRVASESLAIVGRAGAVDVVVSPFFSPVFLLAVARHRRFGFDNRTEAMRELFGDLLPVPFLGRSTKATFDRAFWGPVASRFAEEWDGRGLDPSIVDIDVLKRLWSEPVPRAQTYSLLQAARLATLEPCP